MFSLHRSMLLKPGTGGSGMSKTVLKPCPFCGGKAKERYEYLNGVFVQCNECGISTHIFSSQDAATRAWNRRVGDE